MRENILLAVGGLAHLVGAAFTVYFVIVMITSWF